MISFKQYLNESKEDEMDHWDFVDAAYKDPSWCLGIKRPLAVYGHVKLENSPITHLSPWITFYHSVSFSNCLSLLVAEGAFYGTVNFSHSNVQDISKVRVLGPGKNGSAAYFNNCENLKVASGHYNGAVSFSGSIEEIKDLTIENPDRNGVAMWYRGEEIKRVTNFKYKGEINARPQVIKRIHQLMGQDKAGGKGEFDDLF